jgi:UDP-N-acetylmuramoyl-L-alanyl-D-glutamate--2,6-diaminopimelate ligase
MDDPAWYAALREKRLIAGTPRDVTAICYDSRRVTPGALFVAMRGLAADGHDFIADALERGAAAVIVDEARRDAWASRLRAGVAFVAVPDPRAALAHAAAGFHGHPARSLGVVGVTGTDGKTTTTHLIAHVLTASGQRTGYLSSVEFCAGGRAELNATHMTTVEAPEIQARLAAMRDAGDAYAVLEASSIGLEWHRVDECEFDVGVFTNLAPDHLDFHHTMDAYARAKARLFAMLDASADKGLPKAAVLNADDPASETMRAATRSPVVTYGLRQPADLTARQIAADGLAQTFDVVAFGVRRPARLPLPGRFNIADALAAVAVALSQGIELAAAAEALASFPGVPGRLERIDEGQPFAVVVDIASTEQAMANVLDVLRPVTPGRLLVVFGAAGERDRARRSGIARAVAAHADAAVVTNEDPRSEDPEAILAEIAAALEAYGFAGRYERIADRRQAIARAFELAAPGDTVLLAGKGTEQSIVIGSTHHPWDERSVARELLRA